MMATHNKDKVLVIGLDGVSWNVLDNLIDAGLMPTLKSMKETGIRGDLKSSIPPVTFPAWRCYSTGRDPSQLGVYWWINVNFRESKFVVNNSRSFRGKDIWDYLSEKRLKSIIINMPGTYPVKKLNGILIAGPPNPSLGKSVYPPEMLNKLIAMSYKNMPGAKWSIDGAKVIKESRELQKQQFKLALTLMKKYSWDFFQMTFILTDPILHYFWNYHENIKDSNDEITVELKKFWIELDYYIERLIEVAGKDTYVFMISDHGMTKMKGKIYVNNILKQNGYLKLKNEKYLIDKVISHLPKKQVAQLMAKLHLLGIASKILQRLGMLEKFNPAVDIEITEELVNWDKTRAINMSDVVALIYTNKMRDREEDELFNLLKTLKYDGKRVFDKVYYSTDVYVSPKEDETPRIIAIPKEGYEVSPGLGSDIYKSSERDVWKATHIQKGFLLINGETISAKKMDASIYDIAPTILSLLGIPEEEFRDGTVGQVLDI